MSSTVLVCVCFTLPVCSVNLKRTQATADFSRCDHLYLIFQNGDIDYICSHVSVHGRDVGYFTQNVHLNVEFFPPSCGVLFSKGGGGGDGGVAV